jgi:biotin carboxyl carrier protein
VDKVIKSNFPQVKAGWVWLALVAVLVAIAALFWDQWAPPLQNWVAAVVNQQGAETDFATSENEEAEGGHADPNVLELSEQARRNIGLRTGSVQVQDYSRQLSIPGIVVESPGRSVLDITAPMTGVVTRIYVSVGEAVTPGQKLFDLRFTHEDVVQGQTDFLRTAQELDVIRAEVARLEEATRDGAVARKGLLERQYEERKQEAVLRAQHEALLLHGLNEDQIQQILKTRKLLRSLSVFVPAEGTSAGNQAVLQVQSLKVNPGQHVTTGDPLAMLANHSELLIEGRAFEQDAKAISRALEDGGQVSAVIEAEKGQPIRVENLQISFVAGRVDPQSRALHFYVNLPNELIRDAPLDGRRYIAWRYRPGQRLQVLVPVEKWQKQVVLPVDAIAQDGPETYVFRVNGDHLVRQPVYVQFRDQFSAVIAADGSLYPGDEVALNGAHQLLVALKNKSGGGVDPHAGHSH